MKQKLLTLLLAAILCCFMLPSPAFATHDFSDAERKASALKSLNLFQGVSDQDFDLDRPPTRIEAIIMFLRMIGAEQAAKEEGNHHPFVDVPAWADGYVGYAYQHGYTNGVNETEFGSKNTANAAMYLTFTLRALGYSDVGGADFTYSNPYTLARSTGILTEQVDTKNFLRADIALVSWNALSVPMNGGSESLAELLMISGVFNQSQFEAAIDVAESVIPTVRLGKYTCSTDVNGFTYESIYRPSFTLHSDFTFDITVNFGEGMANAYGTYVIYTFDTGDTVLYLTVDTNGWTETFYLTLHNGSFVLDDWMGITPTGSVFKP